MKMDQGQCDSRVSFAVIFFFFWIDDDITFIISDCCDSCDLYLYKGKFFG